MKCRTPIVNIGRYGRIINKTAIDLMERAFFQKFEARMRNINSKLEEHSGISVVDQWRGTVKEDIAIFQKEQLEHLKLADAYLRLVNFSQKWSCSVLV